MRRLLPLFLLLLAVLGTGCKEEPIVGGKQAERTWVRAVSLSPSTTEIVMLQTKMQLIGRSASCNFPAQAQGLPVVVKGVKPDYEAIQKLSPNVVVYDKELYSEADMEPFKTMGIDTFGLTAETYKGYIDDLYAIGRQSASELKISEYVDLVEAALGAGRSAIGGTKPKVAVILPGNGSEHMIAGSKSFLADALKSLGAIPVGPEAKNFVTANAEWLVAENPDVILTAGDPKGVFNDSRFKGIRAVKDRRVVGIVQDLLLRKGARMERALRRISDAVVGAGS